MTDAGRGKQIPTALNDYEQGRPKKPPRAPAHREQALARGHGSVGTAGAQREELSHRALASGMDRPTPLRRIRTHHRLRGSSPSWSCSHTGTGDLTKSLKEDGQNTPGVITREAS